MRTNTPASLDSQALALRLHDLVGEERNVQVDFILHLDEFDQRRAYLEEGYGSLWDYCLKALHLREGAAWRRMAAMRVLRRFPSMEAALRDGRLCLTTLALLGQVLTDDNEGELLARAAYRSKAEVDSLVASVKPRPTPADGVRKLPEPARAPRGPAVTGEAPPAQVAPSIAARASASPRDAVEPVATPCSGPVAATPVQVEAARPPRRDAPAAEMHAISAGRWSLRVTIDRDLKEHLETMDVRRQVWARDGGRCSWTAPDGRRCDSRWQLELDHIQPSLFGGLPTVDNLRLRCRGHNLLYAERVYGREHMDQFRRERQAPDG